jgi:hypothetical protein
MNCLIAPAWGGFFRVISSHALYGHSREHGVSVVEANGFPVMSNWHIVYTVAEILGTNISFDGLAQILRVTSSIRVRCGIATFFSARIPV